MELIRRQAEQPPSSPKLIKIPDCGSEERCLGVIRRQAKSHWKKISSAAGLGVAFGLVVAGIAAPNMDSRSPVAPNVTVPNATRELARLQTRNRRLEALVQILRTRAQHHRSVRSGSDDRDAGVVLAEQ